MGENKSFPYRLLLRTLIVLYDIVLVLVAALGAYWMTNWAEAQKFTVNPTLLSWAAINVVFVLAIFSALRLYNIVYVSASFFEGMRILFACAVISVCNFIFVPIWGRGESIGYTVILFYSLILFFGSLAVRFSKRFYLSAKTQWQNTFTKKTRVMIVGFNNDAFTLVRNMTLNEKSLYKAVCIVDEDPGVFGKRIYDVRVVGSSFGARTFVKKYKVEEIFVVIPSMKKQEQREVLNRLKDCKLPIRMLPELSKMTHGGITVSKLRNVEIEDLLGREQVNANLNEITGYIENRVVLVTGGGGSIGSELCRQIALNNPRRLIIFDIYENNAYEIEQELKRHYPELDLVTLIGSIRDEKKVRSVFEEYRPKIVFNAAAHKHVPLMETSPNEAVKNNVFGTLNVARAADEFKALVFVQISTDKAVNPTNVMGATKRICEMLIQTIGKQSKNTKFVAVRFGNVLGSNGSVIPLFKKQIAEGGPVTVTHKDIIRYFMTIPEAVSLVLQAGAYAQGGQIFVLDMGDPVRIYDLAYNLIKLSGLEPDEDIEIVCTGLRPGEKLYEERLMAEEGLQKTPNGQINIAQPIAFDEKEFWATMEKLDKAAHEETDKMKEYVKILVPTYTIDKKSGGALRYLKEEKERVRTTETEASTLQIEEEVAVGK